MSALGNPAPARVSGSNFGFLSERKPPFFQFDSVAERLFALEPNASSLKPLQLGEAMAQSIAARLSIPLDGGLSQSDLLYAIHRKISLTESAS